MPDWSLEWNAAAIVGAVEAEIDQRLRLAGILVRDAAKRSINRGNATGRFPSLEGEPPKKVSTLLFNRMAVSEPIADALGRVIYVGTNVIYARRLELGFVGRDKLGRVYHQGPRPFIRPALHNNRDAVAKILGVAA